MHKKRTLTLGLVLLVILSLTACQAPKEQNSTPDPTPTSPVQLSITPPPMPTAEPMITPRPVALTVETVAPEATVILIDPIDKPTRAPLVFAYELFEAQSLGVAFQVPMGWISSKPNDSTLVFTEPEDQAHDGYATKITVQVLNMKENQTQETASAELDNVLDLLKSEYANMTNSDKGSNAMLAEKGPYVNIRIQLDDINALRGRVTIVPKGKKLYQVRYICPANYNSDYGNIYREIRSSMSEI
ncbi:MAG: hypothetical protein RR482_06195 [Clostridia bacterium]